MLSLTLVVLYARVLLSDQVAALRSIKPIEEVVKEFGYPLETHEVTTEDGYILTLHRLPHGRNSSKSEPIGVVFFNNGILLSSAVVLSYQEGFVYSMADAGFDVWVGNYRGNTYSRKHTTLDPDKDNAYWNISLHDFGTKDLPTSIDYILATTGRDKLIYVGASMGTTMFWVLGASRPEYMSKVTTMVAIAPVARPSHSSLVDSSTKYMAEHTTLTTLYKAGYYELFPYNPLISSIIYTSCTTPFIKTACYRLVDFYSYLTSQNVDTDRLVETSKYMPGGIATKVVLHYLQLAHSNKFQQFDYGPEVNQEVYQSSSPPEYNLKNVACDSIFFIASDTDEIAAKEDVEWLAGQLPVRPQMLFPAVNGLGHVGLGLDKDIKTRWYQPLVQHLKQLTLQKK